MNTVLFIDDKIEGWLQAFKIPAKAHGFNIVGFESVDEGLLYLKSNQQEVSAIILDMAFPLGKKQGIDGLKIIKEMNECIPVIMLTGDKNDLDSAVKCMEIGSHSFMDKLKFDPVKLFNIINHATENYNYKRNNITRQIIREEYQQRRDLYESMLLATEMIIRNILKDKLMFTPTYEKRIKSFKSFYEKRAKKEKEEGSISEPFNRIRDIAGLRVILYNSVDRERAVELLQASNDFVDFKTGTDLIPDDKIEEYGYRAVHFDLKLNPLIRLKLEEYKMLAGIPCEVQFKTIFAHSWSKVHHALSYKEVGEVKLIPVEQDALNEDFRIAAMKLEDIEKQITELSAKYFTHN